MKEKLAASFRDPAGFLFTRNGVLYRQVNHAYANNYEALMQSGLYHALVKKQYLIAHEETHVEQFDGQAYKIIRPEKIDNISYPYEWSFSQLKDAALLTLNIQRMALEKKLSLKDASAYNIQFHNGRPVFIDTLSFEAYRENRPWVAYRQFCQHFLAPLALMAKTDISLNQLLCTNIDGIPLQLASKLLPFKTRLSLSLGIHIHLHARSQAKNADKAVVKVTDTAFTKKAFIALVDHLKTAITALQWLPANTEWHDYYASNNNYEKSALSGKDRIVDTFMQRFPVNTTWDLGANTGRFSHIAARYSTSVCAWDIDPACVEQHYLSVRKRDEQQVLPLLLDLANPAPAIGWNNNERMSLQQRSPVDMVLALGLVHHLAISNNLPLEKIACFFQQITQYLIIEFVPRDDSQVVKLLQNREDVFTGYHQDGFEQAFAAGFELIERQQIPDSKRTVYLFCRKP